MHHPTADRPIEHPFGRFQTTCAFFTRLRAAQNVHTAPLHRFMYEHRPAKPRMPGIKNFPFLGPVGVMLSSCIMRCGRTFRLARTHPAHARLKPQGVALVTHTGCFNAAVSTGSCRKRLPVAAKIALVTAGTIAEVPASPIPPGGSELWTMWTSTAGASFMRRIW